MKTVAVFYGGESVEHDVSVITGVMTMNAVDKARYEVLPVYAAKNGTFYTGDELFEIDGYKNLDFKKLKKAAFLPGDDTMYVIKGKTLRPLKKISVAINCTHGERGEDGCIAAICKLSHVPIASPGVSPSAISMEKHLSKTVLRGMGVKTLPSVKINTAIAAPAALKNAGLNFPVIVKPDSGGSSVGISLAKDERELSAAVSLALKFGESAEIEPYAEEFTEINCAAYKNADGVTVVSECEKPFKKGALLSFEDKYVDGERQFPAKIAPALGERVQKITRKVYDELGFEGIVRIDYMIIRGEVYLNEINAVPGSLAYYLFCKTQKSFSSLLTGVIEGAMRRAAPSDTYVKNISTGILDGLKGKGAKRLER